MSHQVFASTRSLNDSLELIRSKEIVPGSNEFDDVVDQLKGELNTLGLSDVLKESTTQDDLGSKVELLENNVVEWQKLVSNCMTVTQELLNHQKVQR